MDSVIISGICRCCSSEGPAKDLTSKYHWMGEEEVYEKMLRDCFSVSLSTPDDDRSFGGICELCITQLRNAYNFKKQVMLTEDMFKKKLTGTLKIVKVEISKDDGVDDSDNNALIDNEDDDTDDILVPIKMEEEYLEESELEKDEPEKEEKPKKRRAKAKPSTSKAKKSKQAAESSKMMPQTDEQLICPECGQYYTTLFNIKRHLLTKHGVDAKLTRKVLCDHCGKTVFSKEYLAKHLALGCKKKVKDCVECEQRFDTKSDMVKHMKREHWSSHIQKMNCPLCDESFKSHSAHDKHLCQDHGTDLEFEELTFCCMEGAGSGAKKKRKGKKKSDESATPERTEHRVNLTTILRHSNASPFRDKTMKGFSCLYCAMYFKDISDLRAHTAQQSEKDKLNSMIDYKLSYNPIKVDITDLQCNLCGRPMKDLNDLKDHLVSVHNKVIHKGIKDIILPFRLLDGNSFSCTVCGAAHVSFKNLYHHMSSHYSNYCCNKCGAGYITIAALRKHNKTHEEGNFKCSFCDKIYSSRSKRRNHEKGVHTGGWLRNKCPHCPEIFVSYYDRNEHLVKVHNEAPVMYSCNACNKIYKKKFELSRHVKHHHLQQRNYMCDCCNAKFFSKRGLIDHMSRHTGGESFTCDVCGKTFSRQRTLREHIRGHGEDKKYQCQVCNKSFMQKCSLKSHVRLHQDDLDIFKEFDDVKHLIDNRDLTLKQIADENKKKSMAGKANLIM